MKLTPNEIRRQQFAKRFQGYDQTEVTAYLNTVASEMEELIKQNKTLHEKTIELETELKNYRSIEKLLHETLMQAKETSGKAMENARQEAQLLIQEAELKSSNILDKARNDLTVLKEQITILKAKKDSIVSRLKMLLQSELELIKALETDEELQEGPLTNKKDFSKEREEIEEIIKSLNQ